MQAFFLTFFKKKLFLIHYERNKFLKKFPFSCRFVLKRTPSSVFRCFLTHPDAKRRCGTREKRTTRAIFTCYAHFELDSIHFHTEDLCSSFKFIFNATQRTDRGHAFPSVPPAPTQVCFRLTRTATGQAHGKRKPGMSSRRKQPGDSSGTRARFELTSRTTESYQA